ncbi:hypothetical protein BON30_26410 [Cystobacter ferrugineus]|uniref:Type II secretion system protein GspG C-terminal domain-containing protein n=2 Tax=Cystobacter ferrugineus TaxID=83449 RepID=A0A1L9B6R4_9BACT|nr:hypothetical protein BON30_26410 [Cystobacter ferrugineus]
MALLRDFLRFAGRLSFFLMVAIMVFIANMVHHGPEKQDTARFDLKSLQTGLRLYHARHQRYPATEEGLRALVDSLNLDRVPHDPWDHPYGYELREGRPWVWSLGADGAPGGEGEDADVFLPQAP